MSKFIFLLAFFISSYSFSQLVVDAGENVHLCGPNGTAVLGGNPTASGGVPPYTYSWFIDSIQVAPFSSIYYKTHHFLTDISSANPTVVSIQPQNDLNTGYFKLTVTDALGEVAVDSVQVTESEFGQFLVITPDVISVLPGDSIFVGGDPSVVGGIGSLSYLWYPTEGLSVDTLPTNFWITPISNEPYGVQVTDSMGCQFTGAPSIYIHLSSLGISDVSNKHLISYYPNPVSEILHVTISDQLAVHSISLVDLQGKLIRSYASNLTHLNLSGINSGNYLLVIQSSHGSFQELIQVK